MISFISSIIFSLIDSLFFLIGEDYIQKTLLTIPFIDQNMAELITGGISSAISILFFSLVKQIISKKYNIIDNPYIDAIGILLGTFIVITIYKLFVNIKI
jgi:hypothetical protein